MQPAPDNGRYLDGVVVVFLLALIVFSPPLIQLWATSSSPWWLPYAVWCGVIVLIALVQRVRGRYDL